MSKTINFKQPKYILPAILYFPLLGLGYLVIDIFNVEIKKGDPSLQTTEYLNSELPRANVSRDIGGKRDNMERSFGRINDLTAVDNIENDRDSVMKKEDYESKYSEEEKEKLAQAEAEKVKEKKDKEKASASSSSRRSRSDLANDSYSFEMSDNERAAFERMRRSGTTGNVNIMSAMDGEASMTGNSTTGNQSVQGSQSPKAEKEEEVSEVKKLTKKNAHFNTLSDNDESLGLIRAIIDENIKAVDGSRVRLRLLDDIEIDGKVLKKGTYLYCTMSGFSSQRVKASIKTVLVGDDFMKVNLSIYDTDGLEGLYVPESQFREAVKDVGSQTMEGQMTVNEGMNNGNSVTQWASNALQSGYQKITQAMGKAIKKNKVKLKYGTHVYLVNNSQKKKNGKK